MMKKIYPLPTENEFYLELHVFRNADQLGEWVESPSEYPEGVFIPNHHKEEDADFYKVGSLFIMQDEMEVTNLASIAVEAALNYAALLSAFLSDDDREERAEFCQNAIVEGTRHVLGELLDVKEEYAS